MLTDLVGAIVYFIVAVFGLGILGGFTFGAVWVAYQLFGYVLPSFGLSIMRDFRSGETPLAQFFEEMKNPQISLPAPPSEVPESPKREKRSREVVVGELLDD